MKIFLTFFLTVSLMVLQGCYVSKPLDRDVHISLSADFPVVIKNTGNSNFVAKHTEAEYRSAFMDQLTKELGFNHVIVDGAAPEFIVKVTSLELHESTKMDTVKDVKSKDNGMVRELTLAGLKASGTVTKNSGGNAGTWDAEKGKDEKLTHNQSLDQIIAGENKDNSQYREKNFDDNEFIHLSSLCGRRAAVRIEKEIRKQLQ